MPVKKNLRQQHLCLIVLIQQVPSKLIAGNLNSNSQDARQCKPLLFNQHIICSRDKWIHIEHIFICARSPNATMR
jgi:hypothetical protein